MVLETAPISDLPAARKAVLELQQKGCGAVVLTLGHNGVVFCESRGSPVEHVPAEPVQAVDTTVGCKRAHQVVCVVCCVCVCVCALAITECLSFKCNMMCLQCCLVQAVLV